MRKLFVILVVSMLLMSALAPAALAEPKPADEYIPFEVDLDPGFAFEDWWIELNPDEGGTGIELPQADDEVFGDPDPEADPTSGLEIFRGLDMGFNFKYFEGPSRGIPTYDTSVDPPVAVRWSQELTNEGYDKIWVGTNGYLVFGYHCDLTPPYRNECRDWFTHDEISYMVMYPPDFTWYRAVPSPARPNNLLNVFMTDLTFGDNSFVEVDSVAFVCEVLDDECGQVGPGTTTVKCNGEKTDMVSGPGGCVADKDECWIADCQEDCDVAFEPGPERDECYADCDDNAPRLDVQGYWMPCDTHIIERPRGRLLYKTVGEEPNRKFVVEWANARVWGTGGLATFQAQLWEGNNAILFLYKDFKPMAYFEDPPHEAAFTLIDTLVVGLEDFYGEIGVGQAYFGHRTASPGGWALFNPLDELSAMGFAPDAYTGVRPFTP
jgi:hypothetical protein